MKTQFQGRAVLRAVAAMILVAVVLTGCGEQGSQTAGVGTGGTGSYAMGGSIQGKELSLVNVVTTIAGDASTVAGTASSADGTGTEARFDWPTAITSDGTNLYVADSGKHTIRKIVIATGVVTTLAGRPGIAGTIDGIGSAARFTQPKGITNDGTYLYVSDTGSATIRKIQIATGSVTTLAGSAYSQGSTDGTGSEARFTLPSGIITDGINLYVVDNCTVRKIVISSGMVSTIAGTAGVAGSTDDIGIAARLYYPEGIATDGANLYVTESKAIRKIVIATAAVSTLVRAGDSEEPRNYEFFNGITTDGTTLYVTAVNSASGWCIRKVTIATGAIDTLNLVESSTPHSPATATFFYPTGISTDGVNLYVADSGNKRIRIVQLSTSTVTTLAGSPPTIDGVGTAASFSGPTGITSDGRSLYVTEPEESIIRKVDIATGTVSTLAGMPYRVGSTDGAGAEARFYSPTGITTDGTSLFVTDAIANVIRKIEMNTGKVTTLAGSAWLSGSQDGTGTEARFYQPYGITTDGRYLYITEGPTNTIRKVEISTGAVTTLTVTASPPWSADPDGLGPFYVDRLGITTDGTRLFVADGGAIRTVHIDSGSVTTLVETGESSWINGITSDGTNIYISQGGAIRKVVISTSEVTTVAGAPGSVGSSEGAGATASFANPSGLTTDGKYLYIADHDNGTIRRIQ